MRRAAVTGVALTLAAAGFFLAVNALQKIKKISPDNFSFKHYGDL